MGRGRCRVGVVGLGVLVAVLVGCGSPVAGSPQAGPSASIRSTESAATEPRPPTEATDTAGATGTAESSSRTSPTESSATAASTTSTTSTTSVATAIKTFLPDPPGGSKKNQYGDIIAQPGQTYGLYLNDEQTVAFVFRVDSIQLDKGCAAPTGGGAAAEPENSHFVVVKLDVDLRNVTEQDLEDQGIDFSRSSWEAFDAEGNPQTGVHSDAGIDCAGEHDLGFNDPPKSGQLSSGLIVLDVDAAKGTLLFKTGGLSNGWEYAYG